MQKAIFVITLGLLTGGEQILAAAEICAIEPVTDARIANRAKQMRFADGRVITVIGDQAGGKEALTGLPDSKEMSAISAEDFERSIRRVLHNDHNTPTDYTLPFAPADQIEQLLNLPAGSLGKIDPIQLPNPGTASDNARDDEIYLRTQLASTKNRPEFVGVEAKDAPAVEAAKKSYQLMKSQVDSRRKQMTLTDLEVDDFLRSASGGGLHAYFSNPDLAKTAPLVATGDADGFEIAAKDSDIDPDTIYAIWPKVLEHMKSVPAEQKSAAESEVAGAVKTALKLIQQVPSRYSNYESGDAVAEELAKAVPPWLKDSAKDLVQFARVMAGWFIEHDRQTAHALAALNKSGIEFVRIDRLDSVMGRLAQECKAVNAAPEVLNANSSHTSPAVAN